LAYYQQNIDNFIKSTGKIAKYESQINSISSPTVSISPTSIPATDETATEINEKTIADISNNTEGSSPIFNQNQIFTMLKPLQTVLAIFFLLYIIITCLPEILIAFGLLEASKKDLKYAKVTGVFGLVYSFGTVLQMILILFILLALINSSIFPMLLIGIFNNIFGLV